MLFQYIDIVKADEIVIPCSNGHCLGLVTQRAMGYPNMGRPVHHGGPWLTMGWSGQLNCY